MPSQTGKQDHSLRLKAFSLAILCAGGGLNVYRSLQALRQVEAFRALPAAPAMQRLAISSLLWGAIFIACGLGLWQRRRWAWLGAQIAVTLYHIHIWINHLAFAISDYARQTRPLAASNSIIVLLLVWGFLYLPLTRTAYSVAAPREE